MNDSTLKVIEAIAQEVSTLTQIILDGNNVGVNTKTGRNTLADSNLREHVQTQIQQQGDGVVITALFDNYVSFLEWDRPPRYGKQPPIDALRDWALSRGIPTDNSTLFLISRAIWRDGHEGRPILATLEQEIDRMMEDEMYDKLYEAITEELTKYFN